MLRGVVIVMVVSDVGVGSRYERGGRTLNNLQFEVLNESFQRQLQSASAQWSF